ncbi:MAG: hypothetical protein JW891_18395 [Candidatus Lokiarchaeota archaeon]|nr:hypothetical protein [Candidatus Lokiarchaeota archaeon]
MSNNNSEKIEFLYTRKPKHLGEGSADDKFDVILPKKYIAVLLSIFAILFLIQFIYFSGLYLKLYDSMLGTELYSIDDFPIWPYWYVPLLFLAISIVPLLAWGEIGSRFASKSMVKYLRKTVSRKRPGPGQFLLGYPLRTKDIYYLEAYPMDLDLGSEIRSIKVFVKRVVEVLSISIGMSVLISQFAAPYIWEYVSDYYSVIQELMVDMTIYIGPFSLLILTYVMPTFWVAEDTQAYRINELQDTIRLGYYLRSGILSKILGFFGIVLVYNLANQFAACLVLNSTEAPSIGELMKNPLAAANVFGSTFLWFGIILGMSAAVPFMISLLYLGIYHERWVNNTRIKASEFMDLGTLQIKKPDITNLKYMKHPEKLDETGGFFQDAFGKIILITLVVLTAIICIYSAFLFGYEQEILGVGEDLQDALFVILYVLAFVTSGLAILLLIIEIRKKKNRNSKS